MPEAAIADAGPLIHLDELSHLFLFECYSAIWVPKTVADETEKFRPGWFQRGPAAMRKVDVPKADIEDFRRGLGTALDDGETESLAFWKRMPSASVVCDDLCSEESGEESGRAGYRYSRYDHKGRESGSNITLESDWLLKKVYTEARYEPRYRIAKDDLAYLEARILRLRKAVEQLCEQRIAKFEDEVRVFREENRK